MNDTTDTHPSSVKASPRSTPRSRAASVVQEEQRADIREPVEPESHVVELDEFCLIVAGDHGGKSSFLRLLLETTPLANPDSPETQQQRLVLDKFISTCAGSTRVVRSVTVNVLATLASSSKLSPSSSPKPEQGPVDVKKNAESQHRVPVALTVVDTPSMNTHVSVFDPEPVLHYVEGRLKDSLDSTSRAGLMHLCIYFLDPMHLQSLPRHHIETIHRLSSRVNVLPVICKADTLSNHQLRAAKAVVRRDLAEAGIGFGIFDQDPGVDRSDGKANGTHDNAEASKQAGKIPDLPYAIISPDSYDALSFRAQSSSTPPLLRPNSPLFHSTPSKQDNSGSRFTRTYRWGSLDVLDPAHTDFNLLRHAIFYHSDTLRDYTKQYLFERFKQEFNIHAASSYRYPAYAQPQGREPPPHPHSREHHPGASPTYPYHPVHSHHPSQSSSGSSSRPVLAIDTGSSSESTPRHAFDHGAPPPATSSRSRSGPEVSGKSKKDGGEGTGEKGRAKKITVACNFCRSRKLKCDGIRPACVQCLKRNNPCDYETQGRRRGAKGKRDKGDKDSSRDKAGKEAKSTNGNGSSSGTARPGSRRSKNSGSREESEDGDEDQGSGTGSQDAEGDEDDEGDVDMIAARRTSRSPAVGRSRHGSMNEYPPQLSQPAPYHRPPNASTFTQPPHPTLPSISAEFPPPHSSHTRSRVSSISSLTGPMDRERDQRERGGGYELPHIATLSLPDPTARHHQPSSRLSPHQPPHPSQQHGHHSRGPSTSHLPHPGPPPHHLPPPHHQHTRSPPHLLPPPHLHSPHLQSHHLSASTPSTAHISPHQSSASSGSTSAHLSPHLQHHRLPSPHQHPHAPGLLHSHSATSRKRAATAPSKTSGPLGMGNPNLPPPVPGPPRASDVSRGRSSTTSGANSHHPHPHSDHHSPPVESLGVGGSSVNMGSIGSVTAGMIRATGRLPSTSGPKIVACNFCRARKTKCDGAHPSCGSCARRNLPCNYVHERGGRRSNAAQGGPPAGRAMGAGSPGAEKKAPNSSGRGSKRMSDPEGEDAANGGRKKMRVGES